jgi:hypothetical protein
MKGCAMKKMVLAVCGLLACGVVRAEYKEGFESFPAGSLKAQDGWEVSDKFSVAKTKDAGVYTGGQAVRAAVGDDKTIRHEASGVDFKLTMDKAGIEYGFDFRDEATSMGNTRMYLRSGASPSYAPSFGLKDGVMVIRTAGEMGDQYVTGANFSEICGAGSSKLWNKGDWLRVSLILTGDKFQIATVKAVNLSRGGIEIPTGITDADLSKYNVKLKGITFDRAAIRMSGSSGTFIDNVYVKDAEGSRPSL